MNRFKEFLDEHLNQVLIGLVITIVVLILIVAMALGGHGISSPMGSSSSMSSTSYSRSGTSSGFSHSSRPQRAFVDVEGAVKKPGVYQFTNNMRIVDAINLAGGMRPVADRKRLNLAQKLVDQQVVYVPAKGEKGVPSSSASAPNNPGSDHSSKTSNGGGSGQININQADASALMKIRGFGNKRSAKIIDYRKSHGDFKNIADLKKIPGIGQKIFDNIKSQITV